MFGRVIVGVDGDTSGRDAVAVARLLVDAAGRLSLVDVHELTPWRGASGAYGPDEDEESLALLEAEREATGVEADLLTVTASSVGRGLHYLAEREHADMRCVGSSARGFAGRVPIGDVTRAALIGAPCAFLIVGSRGCGPIRSLMLGSTAVYPACSASCPLLMLPRRAER